MKKVNNKITLEELKSGYVVKLKNGKYFIVARAGRFTKVLVGIGSSEYLSRWGDDLKYRGQVIDYSSKLYPVTRRGDEYDIVEVYGLVNDSKYYHEAVSLSIEHRPLIWERNPVTKMTLKEVCEKLGYDIELIKE